MGTPMPESEAGRESGCLGHSALGGGKLPWGLQVAQQLAVSLPVDRATEALHGPLRARPDANPVGTGGRSLRGTGLSRLELITRMALGSSGWLHLNPHRSNRTGKTEMSKNDFQVL